MIPTRCSPVTMRKCLEIVEALKSAEIEFVPIPVLNAQTPLTLLALPAVFVEPVFVRDGALPDATAIAYIVSKNT